MSPEVTRIALALYEANGTALSLSCYILLKYKEYGQLAAKAVDPAWYTSHDAFFRDNSSVCFLKKYADFPRFKDTSREAIDTFLACEKGNLVTNNFLKIVNLHYSTQWYESEFSWTFPFIRRAQRFIRRVLGALPDTLEGRFGPGATYGDKGLHTTVLHKMSSKPTLTSDASPVIDACWHDTWALRVKTSGFSTEVVRGNRLTTVPKTALTDRPICIEPSLNLYFQLGVGGHIRSRLKKFGIDIKNGQQNHSRYLLTSSGYSTIDLTSASDTLSYELVRLLLPEQWFNLLDMLRSPSTNIGGRWYHQQKFSSMGNGFTFELETLIFSALCVAVNPEAVLGDNTFVYGDDIIVPRDRFDDTVAALRFFGFTPNKKKSFRDGSFFESCGMDVFNGIPSRAFYLKEEPNDPQKYFVLLNGLRELSDRYSGDYRVFDLYRRPWLRALDCLPIGYRSCRGPSRLGSLCIYDHDAPVKVRHGVRYYRVLRETPQWYHLSRFHPKVQMAGCLYGAVSSIGVKDVVSRRRARTDQRTFRIGWGA